MISGTAVWAANGNGRPIPGRTGFRSPPVPAIFACTPRIRRGRISLWDTPQLLLQKFQGPAFTATTRLELGPGTPGDRAGLIVFGREYAGIAVRCNEDGLALVFFTGEEGGGRRAEREVERREVGPGPLDLRVNVNEQAECRFSYSAGGKGFAALGRNFQARPGVWVGAKVGLFCQHAGPGESPGYGDFAWFRVE